ncbi:hypothetical protein [Prevotella ihumii]|uniref:hypothetical protein n=1 Tax=Prevotella ihumii TaxID=1917878 RepID=UPI001F255277|nr:hypothetical protein [Prevotella ihumii]
MDILDIEAIERKYNKISIWLISGLTLGGLLLAQALVHTNFITPLIISAVVFSILNSLYGKSWKAIAIKLPNVLGKFYLIGSMVRMFATLTAIVVGVLIYRENKEMTIAYVAVFVVFYLVTLVFDSVYFFQVEKNNKNK